jgi:hypothetical protein
MSIRYDYNLYMQKRSRKKKRPDLNELAADIIQETIDSKPEEPSENIKLQDNGKNPAAVALGRLGGLKGGKARWRGIPKKKRSELARKAALARWHKPEK